MSTRNTARTRRDRPAYRCAECGWTAVRWVGRCGECQAWGTVEEVGAPSGSSTLRTAAAPVAARAAVPIAEVDPATTQAVSSGIGELDRVLGGGLVPGAVVLVAGEPGIGKSTLLLDAAARGAARGRRVLYVSGEESAGQVRLRAERIRALESSLYLAAETDLAQVLAHIDAIRPELLIVDSVQTVASDELDGSAGNVSQVREVAAALIQAAKSRGMATLLVGHVTKDGSIAGPRVLEHLVDVVLAFEGERHSRLRLVRAVKNRYGPTDEVGCFEMGERGILGLPDPSGLFLSARDAAVPGTAVTVALEGRRPLVCEVQALLNTTQAPSPRRTTSGVDYSRTAMILAVLERHAQVKTGKSDCYVSTVGGVRLGEPAADLALALAVAGSALDVAPRPHTIAIGEVGLAGDIRRVDGLPRRLREAARLGFRYALVPPATLEPDEIPRGLSLHPVDDIATAVRALNDTPALR